MATPRSTKPDNITRAETIMNYFAHNRGVGHTRAMMEGVRREPRCLVLLSSRRQASLLDLQPDTSVLEIEVPDLKHRLLGRTEPLVIDHFALSKLLYGVVREYDSLAEDHRKLLEKVKELEGK